MSGAHDVDGKGFYGNLVGQSNKRLSREVEDYFRFHFPKGHGEGCPIRKISTGVRCQPCPQSQLIEEQLVRLGIERIAVNLCAERKQPLAKPRALEASVASDEDPSISIEVGERHNSKVNDEIEGVD
jgi:hypothetical protein